MLSAIKSEKEKFPEHGKKKMKKLIYIDIEAQVKIERFYYKHRDKINNNVQMAAELGMTVFAQNLDVQQR